MKAFFRLLLNCVVGGALAGVLITTLAAPKFITWDNTSAAASAMCVCADVTRQTAERLIHAQMMGLAIGAGVGALAAIVIRILRKKPSTAALPPAAAP